MQIFGELKRSNMFIFLINLAVIWCLVIVYFTFRADQLEAMFTYLEERLEAEVKALFLRLDDKDLQQKYGEYVQRFEQFVQRYQQSVNEGQPLDAELLLWRECCQQNAAFKLLQKQPPRARAGIPPPKTRRGHRPSLPNRETNEFVTRRAT